MITIPHGAVRAETPDPGAREVLEDERYRFCHEDDYPMTADEQAWCPLVGKRSDACPSLPEACKRPPVAGNAFYPGRLRRSEHDARRRDEQAADPPPAHDAERAPTPPPPQEDSAHVGLSGFARVLLILVLAAFVIAIARALAKNFVRDRAEVTPDGEATPGAPAPDTDTPRGPVETDVDRLLARARSAAARGDHGRAIDDAYAALLRRLDGDGLIDIHPSHTNGDYLRRLGDQPDLRRAVRDVARDVERVQFGDVPPSEGAWKEVLARVLPLLGRAAGVALLCFGLATALSCTPHTGEADQNADDAPLGTRAVAELLEKHKVAVRHRTEPLAELTEPTTVVLLSGAVVDEATWTHLLAWVRDKGGHLVLAGVSPPADLGLRVVSGGDPRTQVGVVLHAQASLGVTSISLPAGARVASATGDDDATPGVFLWRGASIYAVARDEQAGKVTVFADDGWFTNAALAAGDDATFLVRFFTRMRPAHEVQIADAWTGVGAATPIEAVGHAHLTPVVAQLLVLLALLFLWKGVPFAALRDPPAETRRAFADHARALGVAYARARASRHVLGLYAVWALERLRERVHRAGRQGLIPLAEAIAARSGCPEAEVMSVLVEASGARDEAAPPSSFRPRHDAAPPSRRARRDESEVDLALIRKLQSFLAATGQRRPARRTRDPRP
jgi:hypothetical protein